MAEPRLVRLGEVADFLTGFPFKSANYTDEALGIRLIRGDNIVQGAIRWDGVKRWPAHLADQSEEYRLFPGDVVLAMDRPWIEAGLKYAALSDDDCPSLLVQRVTRLRGTQRIDKGFLRYVIGGRDFTGYVLAVQTGTAVPHISGGQIKAFQFLLPEIVEQRSIASVLGALDNKIEINQRMNETLEAIARAIFKDWFVDFGPTRAKAEGRPPYLAPDLWSLFPNHLDEVERPEGWNYCALGDIFDVGIGRTPPRIEAHHFVPVGLGHTWLSIKNMGGLNVWACRSDENLAAETVDRLHIPIVPANTVVVSFKLTVGRVAITSHPMCTNEAIAHLVERRGSPYGPYYTYLHMAQYDYTQLGSTSSIATAVNSKSIKSVKILNPGKEILLAFETTVSPIFRKILANLTESNTLAQTRDLLLPKLMSGEIRIRDAERVVEAAA